MVLELLKAFVRKPFQEKYLPVFACLLIAVVLTAITHTVLSFVVPVVLGVLQIFGASRPINRFLFAGFVMLAAAFASLAVMALVKGLFLAALVEAVVGSLPLSIVFTRPQQEKIK